MCTEQVEIGADFSTPKAGECRDATQRSYSPLRDRERRERETEREREREREREGDRERERVLINMSKSLCCNFALTYAYTH